MTPSPTERADARTDATSTPSPTEAQRERFPARLTRAVGAAAIPALFFATAADAQVRLAEAPQVGGVQPAETRDAPAADAPGAVLYAGVEGRDEIIVTGRYLAQEKFGAAKTPTPVIDIPQSLSITTEEQIAAQAFRDMGDILRFTPGAAVAQGEGHRDQITLRGQNTTADFFLDGIRDDVQYFRPLYNLEQVEVLRGSNALVFGRGGGGGAINRVTKRPDTDARFVGVEASADTFGSAYLAGDVNQPLSDVAGFRLNAFAETLDNHRREFGGERWAVNPTLSFQWRDTRFDASIEHIEDDRTVDRGVPSLGGEPVEGFRDTFFGSPDLNETELSADIARLRVDHSFAPDVSANATLHWADYDKIYQNLYPIGIDLAAGTVGLDGYRDTTDRENLIAQANLVAEFATGGVGHTLLVGAEYGDQATSNTRADALFADSLDDQIVTELSRFTGATIDVPSVAFPALTRDRDSDVEFASLYIQDQVDFGRVQLIGGLRYDDFSIAVEDRANARTLASDDGEWSPRLGAIYKPADNVSVYASYSKTFLPRAGDQFLTLSPTAAALAPEEFETREVGIKWDPVRGFSLTASLFDLDREGATVVDPRDAGNALIVGSETRGLELEASGRLGEGWTVYAGYSYLDAEQTGNVVGGTLANNVLPSVPEHMAFAWTRYDFAEVLDGRFGVAAGFTYQSEQFASISNAVALPDFLRVDAAAYFQVSDAVELRLNVENLFDAGYFPAAHNDNNISTGEPINARLTLGARF